MSSWREQHVLRMPATTIGIHTNEEWNAFLFRKAVFIYELKPLNQYR